MIHFCFSRVFYLSRVECGSTGHYIDAKPNLYGVFIKLLLLLLFYINYLSH